MADADISPASHPAPAHGSPAHGGGRGHDEHAHEEPLGPLDLRAWAAALAGAAIAALVAVALFVATQA